MSKGHNFYGGMSAEHLKQFIMRIERVEIQKKECAEDIKCIFAEAKSTGFDVPAMKEIIKMRRLDAADLEAWEYLIDTYKAAMGMGVQKDLFDDSDEVPAVATSITIGDKTFKNVDLKKAAEFIGKRQANEVIDKIEKQARAKHLSPDTVEKIQGEVQAWKDKKEKAESTKIIEKIQERDRNIDAAINEAAAQDGKEAVERQRSRSLNDILGEDAVKDIETKVDKKEAARIARKAQQDERQEEDRRKEAKRHDTAVKKFMRGPAANKDKLN